MSRKRPPHRIKNGERASQLQWSSAADAVRWILRILAQ